MCGKRVKFNCQIRFMRLKFSNWFMYDNISQAKKTEKQKQKQARVLRLHKPSCSCQTGSQGNSRGGFHSRYGRRVPLVNCACLASEVYLS